VELHAERRNVSANLLVRMMRRVDPRKEAQKMGIGALRDCVFRHRDMGNSRGLAHDLGFIPDLELQPLGKRRSLALFDMPEAAPVTRDDQVSKPSSGAYTVSN
jgi:hypothetical protein